jgi:serine/threonine-protein kinase
MSAIVEGNIPPPSTYRKDLPPQLEEIILRALHPVPDERYQTADELRVDLDRFARKAGLRGSTTDLADYMRQIFGQRPEPWLVEAAELTQEVMDVDFDGSASGAAVVPKREGGRLATGLPTPSPDSPIARVRRRVAPAGGVAIMTESPEPGHAPAARSSIPPASPVAGWDSEDKPTTASGTPMAWTPGAPPLPPVRARRWGIAVGVVGALALGVVAIVRPWSGGSQSSPATPAAATAPPLPSPPAEPAKLAEPPPAEPAKLAEPAPPAEPAKPSATPRPVVVKNPAPKSPKTKPDPRKPRFDPKSLFPE